MSQKTKKLAVHSFLEQAKEPLSLPEIRQRLRESYVFVAERTLRRWLCLWTERGLVQRTGKNRGTRYQLATHALASDDGLQFLDQVPASKRKAQLAQLRDAWTHSAITLEGNTFTLGDVHAVLELGLTVEDKSPQERQQVVNYASALRLLFGFLDKPLARDGVLQLHKVLQSGLTRDSDQPAGPGKSVGSGEWRRKPAHTSVVLTSGEGKLIDHPEPEHLDALVQTLVNVINNCNLEKISKANAAVVYAQVHLGLTHIHPFAAANVQMACLLANIILLKAGVPPLLIDPARRREYTQLLADYQSSVGQLTRRTDISPDDKATVSFGVFCNECYAKTIDMFG